MTDRRVERLTRDELDMLDALAAIEPGNLGRRPRQHIIEAFPGLMLEIGKQRSRIDELQEILHRLSSDAEYALKDVE